MGFQLNDFMEMLGCFKGEESEATHYSTFGGSNWKIRESKNQLFYWDDLSKYWRKWPLTLEHCTPIGQHEPNFRCGPTITADELKRRFKAPIAIEIKPIDYGYGTNRYHGD